MSGKVQDHHRERIAYVYLRQSSLAQVRNNQESTERQYNFQQRAIELGWPAERIRVLAGDLGASGAQTYKREDFKTLVAEVSLGQVGAVFALEAQRLARSSADWHRLMELCALSQTLIIDADGCYAPSDFNDGLLLGLKATMSQAELHFMRERLHGGKLNKAERGDLRVPLPIGYCYDEQGKVVQDPDEQVRKVVALLFATFREVGSAYAVVQRFAREGLLFPLRQHGGPRHGQLVWRSLTYTRLYGILRNPVFSGAYVYGRRQSFKALTDEGEIYPRWRARPMEEWLVKIKDHHEGYISWQNFLENLAKLENNQPLRNLRNGRGAAREGKALLQGLLLCGKCGRRLVVSYRSTRSAYYPDYTCNARKCDGHSEKVCISIRGDVIEQAVAQRALEVLAPANLEIALRAAKELEQRDATIHEQWRLSLQRAEYEVQLAERRYEEVDPAYRLVANTLEKRWNEALERLEQVRQQAAEQTQRQARMASPEQRDKVLALARDLPKLWQAPSTRPREKKRMLRLLIKDITITEVAGRRQVLLQIRWQGGALEERVVDRPPLLAEQNRYSAELVARVRKLAAQQLPDTEIAAQLNAEGLRSKHDQTFTVSILQNLRYSYDIPAGGRRQAGELSVPQVAAKLGVTTHLIHHWIRRGILTTRKVNRGSPHWIRLDAAKEKQLRDRIQNSPRLRKARARKSKSS